MKTYCQKIGTDDGTAIFEGDLESVTLSFIKNFEEQGYRVGKIECDNVAFLSLTDYIGTYPRTVGVYKLWC